MNEITYWSFREGNSDKVYELEIKEVSPGMYFVEGRNGRYGAKLTQQIKTKNGPVPYAQARAAYDAEYTNRLRKRYKLQSTITPASSISATVAASQPSTVAVPMPAPVAPKAPVVQLRRDTGLRAMLLTAVDDDTHVQSLIEDDAFGLETKHDGRRVMLIVNVGWDGSQTVRAANRDGEEATISDTVAKNVRLTRAGRFVLDGELIGSDYHPFDLLEDAHCIRHLPQSERSARLMSLLASECPFPRTVTVKGREAKAAALAQLHAAGAEGVVFKRLYAPYSAGRGTDAFKHKFVASATVVVLKVNRKRSIVVGVSSKDGVVPMGNVTIPPNHEVPAVGAIVEVAYLNAIRGDGSLYQPVYKGVRDDKREADDYGSLQFKGEERVAA